jgi:hypothetical protein
VQLEWRPVQPTGPLSNYNHAYLDLTTYITSWTGLIGYAQPFSEVVEGLPQYYGPIRYGNLTSNVFPVDPSTGQVVGDPLDHPSTDGQYPALVGGVSICTDVALIEQEALTFPSTLPYNPWPGGPKYPGPGVNSNSFAWFLLFYIV